MTRPFLSAALAAALAASPALAETLKVAVGYPPGSAGDRTYQAFAEDLAARTDGALEAKVYPMNLLSFAEALSGVRDGIGDLTLIATPYFLSELPRTNFVMELVALGELDAPDPLTGSKALIGAMSEYILTECETCRDEFAAQNQIFLAASSGTCNTLICTTPVITQDDLAGLRVRAGGAFWSRWAWRWGWSPPPTAARRGPRRWWRCARSCIRCAAGPRPTAPASRAGRACSTTPAAAPTRRSRASCASSARRWSSSPAAPPPRPERPARRGAGPAPRGPDRRNRKTGRHDAPRADRRRRPMDQPAAPAPEAFRDEVARFIAQNMPPEMAARNRAAVHPGREDYLGWARILARRGWSAPGWPKEHGGAGWSARQLLVLEEESFRAGAPSLHIQTVDLAGPLIAAFGTEAQKARHLPAIREGRELWAQGFSEPGSGSDLASLSTRAVRDGDHYVVNGQKIWTSDAYFCDRIFCLVRTSSEGRPQQGITMLLFPLDLPGVTVRPIPLIDGGHSLCEVFFDDVRVPVEDRLGEEGQGWACAKHLLAGERVRTAEAPRNAREIARLRAILETVPGPDGRPLIADPLRRARLAELEMDLAALRVGVEMELDGRGAPGLPTPSILKLQGTELLQAAHRFAREALGPHGAVVHDLSDPAAPMAEPGPEAGRGIAAESLFRRAATIYGGSSEVQKGIIAKAIETADPASGRPPVSEDLGMLRDSLAGFLERHAGREARRARAGRPLDEGPMWRRIAAQGWIGAGLPEAAGGFGGGPLESAEVAEAAGRALLTEPISAAVLAARTLAFADPRGQAERLEATVAGAQLPVLVHDGPDAAACAVVARRDGDGWRLSGRARAVPGVPDAGLLLVPARLSDGGPLALFVVSPQARGLSLHACRLLDDRRAADVILDEVRPFDRVARAEAPDRDLSADLDRALDHALVDACAETLGAMDRAFWLARDHVAQRRQFGQALIRFQAIQHRLAEMLVEIQRARAMLEHGLDALSEPDPAARRRAMSRMKARIDRSAFLVGGQAIQLHGGMGLTEDCQVGGCFKRICVQAALMGTADDHLARLAADLAPAAPAVAPSPRFQELPS